MENEKFILKTFSEWQNLYPLPQVKQENLETEDMRNERIFYIPSIGEVCGVIIENSEEQDKALPLIPDAYKKLNFPYTLLKTGNGNKDLWWLPWDNVIDEKTLSDLIANLITTSDLEDNKFKSTLDQLFKNSIADHSQNNPKEYNYIKNKLCFANYIPVEENKQNILPLTTIKCNYINELNNYMGSIELNDQIANLILTSESDKFKIGLYNSKTQLYEEYEVLLHKLGSYQIDEENIKLYGLGNTEFIANQLNKDLEINNIFIGEYSDEPFGIMFSFISNSITSKQNNSIHLYCNLDYIFTDDLADFSSNLYLKHIAKCSNIKTINPSWLPKSVKQIPDWNAFSYSEPGYIKNRICSVLSYIPPYMPENYLENKIILSEWIAPETLISEPLTLPKLKNFNSLTKYKIKLNNQEIIDNLFELPEFNQSRYLLGNKYLYIKFLFDSYANSGIIPDYLENLMQSVENNNYNFCVVLTPQTDNLELQVLIHSQAQKEKTQLLYTLVETGTIIKYNNGTMGINYDNNILDIIREQAEDFLQENNHYYIKFIDDDNIYKANLKGYNEEINKYQILLEDTNNQPDFLTNDVIDNILIFNEKTINYITFNLEEIPYQIKTIDPMWLPSEAKIGKYINDDAEKIFAEVFNDYQNNEAKGRYSHAEGWNTIAQEDYQHVIGKFNEPSSNNIAFILGNGINDQKRSNAYTIDFNGNTIQLGKATATDFVTKNHKLSDKEDITNKTNKIEISNNQNQYPTSQAVIDYFNSFFTSEIDEEGNIVLNISSIDGNGLYNNPFIDE